MNPDQREAKVSMYHNLILFDGVCNFCNTAVQIVIAVDRQHIFKFASIQSELGQQLYRQQGLDPADIQTLMLVDGDRALIKSDAALAVLSRLGGGWQLFAAFQVIPQPLRDWAYTTFARNRFILFGRRATCMVSTPDLQSRFVV